MFIDTASITVQAGRGGNGVDSVYRDKFNRRGFPDGGDGGDGGDVIIRVSTNVHTLLDFKYRRIFKAARGLHGSGKKKRGRDGKDTIIVVPCGTLVYDASNKLLLKDLVEDDGELLVVKGGCGGRGNRSRRDATKGEEGEIKDLFLELKLIADVGIIGFPNVGKSTLISRISKARPKIAAFPFTTKNPILGVVEHEDSVFRVAEIPGLIEDSYKGKGLGDKFLRHAERTKVLMHLIDLSHQDARDILNNYAKINRELKLYNKKFPLKPQIIVGNKLDLEPSRNNFKILKKRLGKDVLAISAKEGIGLDRLVRVMVERLKHE